MSDHVFLEYLLSLARNQYTQVFPNRFHLRCGNARPSKTQENNTRKSEKNDQVSFKLRFTVYDCIAWMKTDRNSVNYRQ